MRKLTSRSRQLIVSFFIWLPFSVFAAQSDHQALVKSSTLTTAEIFSSAMLNTPELMLGEVRQQQANDFSGRAAGWIAGRPSLQLTYVDDTGLGNLGMREFEYGIELPLWRWEQRKNSRSLGDAYQAEVVSWEASLQLYIAGKLRNVLANIASADEMLSLEQDASHSSQQLLEITSSLFVAGEIARLDVMQVESLLLEQKMAELEAEAMVVDAEREYETLTGLHIRPDANYQEVMTSQTEINASHPQLIFLQSDVTIAEENIKKAQMEARGNPVLTLGGRHERADSIQAYNDSFGISINIPFGGKSIVSSQSSAARREKVEAEVLYQNTYRSLRQALHEVEHELFLTEEALRLSAQKNSLSQQRWQMSRSAFTQGEITLVPVIQALAAFQSNQKEQQSLLLKQQRLISEFNQVIGVLP